MGSLRVADDHHLLRPGAGGFHGRHRLTKRKPVVAKRTHRIRAADHRGVVCVPGRGIQGIPSSRYGWRGRPSKRHDGGVASVMELSEGGGRQAIGTATILIAVGMLIALLSVIVDVGMPGLQQRVFLSLLLLWLSIVAHRLGSGAGPIRTFSARLRSRRSAVVAGGLRDGMDTRRSRPSLRHFLP